MTGKLVHGIQKQRLENKLITNHGGKVKEPIQSWDTHSSTIYLNTI